MIRETKEAFEKNNAHRMQVIRGALGKNSTINFELLAGYLDDKDGTAEGLNEIDSYIASSVLNRVRVLQDKNFDFFLELELTPEEETLTHTWLTDFNKYHIKDIIAELRAQAVLLKYLNGVDPIPLLKTEFINEFAQGYIEQDLPLPPRLKLLMTSEQIKQYEINNTEWHQPNTEGAASGSEIEKPSLLKAIENREQGLLAQGIDPKFVEKDREKVTEITLDFFKAMQKEDELQPGIFDQFLKEYPDPRILVDVVLASYKEKLPV